MELGSQIKKHRNELSLSQEELAEKVYVSRQTISNWENDKSYPDVNSLVLLSEIFNVSIDNLIKGDIEIMKEQIRAEDRKEFESLSHIYAILFFLAMLSPIPLFHFLRLVGICIWLVLMGLTLFVALRLEKMKKQFDIQTYREIVAFSEGMRLDDIAKAREEGKRPYQKLLLAFGSGILTLIIAISFAMLLK
ncbi:MAG: helix-turn-helix domain-containing protein [Oscillospiraceae bacterium]|nr:helix-turn-helix domain-containing protein [Oscillospiraceae bacterium]